MLLKEAADTENVSETDNEEEEKKT
jgi:hypothetical protein